MLEKIAMTQQTYPRSPKALLGGIAHLGRFIDKIRLRHAGKIQDYNYITVGFDKYLVDFLQIDPKAFEQRVLAGGTDEELLAWVRANSRKPSDQEIAQWSQGLLSSGPKDDAARQRFQGRLQEVATKRGGRGQFPPSCLHLGRCDRTRRRAIIASAGPVRTFVNRKRSKAGRELQATIVPSAKRRRRSVSLSHEQEGRVVRSLAESGPDL